MRTVKSVALYPRLSSADYKGGKLIDESRSIKNQKAIMIEYCRKRGWNIYEIYDKDDGVSGTTFDRVDFNRMMSDVERGQIDCIIIIDLSRFGRNYVEAGYYRNKLKDSGVRYIAINDNYDSNNDVGQAMNIEVPIKEIFNEYYPAQVSQKVRAVKRMMGEQGYFCNSRPAYGYQKSAKDKHFLVVDKNVSDNVVRIFDLYLGGTSARAIASKFNSAGIKPPNQYYYDSTGKINPYKNQRNMWTAATITSIISNPVYYGAMRNGKRTVRSYKNKIVDIKPVDEWIIVENTHTAIITKERWEQAQTIKSKNKKTVRSYAGKAENIFAGVLKCGACGGNMTFKYRENKTCPPVALFRCSTWVQKGKEACQQHSINYNIVYKAVLADVQQYAVLAAADEEKLIDRILTANSEFNANRLKQLESLIRESKNRIKQIDKIIQSLYEDRVNGDISVEQFKQISSGYQQEQKELAAGLKTLETEYSKNKLEVDDLTEFVAKIKDCLRIKDLTRAIVIELIDHITVSETDKGGAKAYDISIQYKFGVKK